MSQKAKMQILDHTQPEALQAASQVLSEGELVILPTETVYGLAALATNTDGIAKIYAAKGRPSHNPLILHVGNIEMAKHFGEFSKTAQKLAESFWPGPLTMVLPKAEGGETLPAAISAGNATIAIRNPKGMIADLSISLDGPIAAPSANLSGRISATKLNDIAEDFEGKVSLALKGDETNMSLESTIVLVEDTKLTILRPGSVTIDDLQAVCPECGIGTKAKTEALLAPGMMFSHYAPNAPVQLNALEAEQDDAYLAFGEVPETVKSEHVFQLSLGQNFEEAASRLYQGLHELDRQHPKQIIVAPIAKTKLGIAIMDRLQRAAAPRT